MQNESPHGMLGDFGETRVRTLKGALRFAGCDAEQMVSRCALECGKRDLKRGALDPRRRLIEKRAQKELGRIQKQIQKQPLVIRAEALRAGATERIEGAVTTFLDVLPIATKADIGRIDRKVSALGRKLKEMEKGGGTTEA